MRFEESQTRDHTWFILCFLLISAVMLMTGCGAKLENETVYRVEGDATIHVVVGIDVTPCKELPEYERAECIRALIELAKAAQQQQEEGNDEIQGG